MGTAVSGILDRPVKPGDDTEFCKRRAQSGYNSTTT